MNNTKTRTIDDYRKDIQLLKHKINKLVDINHNLKANLQHNDSEDSLYRRPLPISQKHKDTQYYFDELLRICKYRGFTLESLYRCVDIDLHFAQFLRDFLLESNLQEIDKIDSNEVEVSKLVTYITTTLDFQLKGTITQEEYYMILQAFQVESEGMVFRHLKIGGGDTFQNVFHYSLETVKKIFRGEKINSYQIIKIFVQTKNKDFNLEQFQKICLEMFDLNFILSLTIFKYIDRYKTGVLTIENMKNFFQSLLEDNNFNIQTQTAFMTINLFSNQSSQINEIALIFEKIKVEPIDFFVNCAHRGKSMIPYQDLLRQFDIEMNKIDFQRNKFLQFLRLLDECKSGFISSFQFVYALMTKQNLGYLYGSPELRAHIVNQKGSWDIESLSLLALRMNAFGMKPADWFRMMSHKEDSLEAFIVRDSLMQKLGLSLYHSLNILKSIDQNINFFIEYDEIVSVFGEQLKINYLLGEEEDYNLAVRNLVDEIFEKYGSLDVGVEKIFVKFDTDKSGTLSREEFLYALDQFDDKMRLSEDYKARILEKADKNRDNQITILEFKQFLMETTDFPFFKKSQPSKIVSPLITPIISDRQKIKVIQQQRIFPNKVVSQMDHICPQAEIIYYIRQYGELQYNYGVLIEQLQLQGDILYKDPDFPPVIKSISNEQNNRLCQLNLEFKRPNEYLDNPEKVQLYEESVTPNDIIQGQLGDCYFLSALSALAEKPNLVRRLFENQIINHWGVYCIWLCLNGQFQAVIIDDFVPCIPAEDHWQTAFSKANGNELWVILLEKAYAKAYQSYSNIESGFTGQALRDLTGAPYEFIYQKPANQVWNFLQKNKLFLITAGSQTDEKVKDTGIISTHAYTVLDTKQVITKGSSYQLIKLRNPWGHGEWKGAWSDGSQLWTQEIKQMVGYEEKDDGIFWMQIEDFVQQFSEVCANKIYENYIYSYVKLEVNQNRYIGLVKFQTTQSNQHGFLTISQVDKRMIIGQQKIPYQYSLIRFIIYQGRDDKIYNVIQQAFGGDRDVHVELTFKDKSEYILIFEIDWNNIQKANSFVISTYSQSEVLFLQPQQLNLNDSIQIIKNILLKTPFNPEITKYKDNHQITFINGLTAGYIYFLYKNESEGSTLYENIQFKNIINLSENNGEQIKSNYQVQLEPKTSKILFFRGTSSQINYEVTSDYKIITNYSDQELINQALNNPSRQKTRETSKSQLQVYAIDYIYDQGIALVLINKSNTPYKEHLKLKLINMNGTLDHIISLKPQESYLIRLNTIDQTKPISYSSEFFILNS